VALIRLRRRPRPLAVDECVNRCKIDHEPEIGCFGGFRHRRITLRSLGVGGYVMEVPWALPVGLHYFSTVLFKCPSFVWLHYPISKWSCKSLTVLQYLVNIQFVFMKRVGESKPVGIKYHSPANRTGHEQITNPDERVTNGD